MLSVMTADRVGPLASRLAEVLATPVDDPFARDWVAVPTEGMRRWLQLELARSLGASAGGHDGVAANIELAFPGALRRAVLDAERADDDPDPWRVDRLVWTVLDVLTERERDPALGPATVVPPGATRFGRARRLADLLDRYVVHRPELLLAWTAGHDVDPQGGRLPAHQRWQPHLWRLVRDRIGEPSPPERLPDLLGRLRAGTLAVDLPGRLALFGITTLPGGAPFLDLAAALGATRDVSVLLLDPSPAATRAVRAAAGAAAAALPPEHAGGPVLRRDDRTDTAVRHPLVRSWARPHREATVLLARAAAGGPAGTIPDPEAVGDDADADGGGTDEVRTLLAKVQHDLRNDTPPAGDWVLAPDDRSVQLHACYGPARQVEVIRDAILHLLADDLTLREEDVVVLCPSIDEYAPLVEAVFGPSAGDPLAPIAGPPDAGTDPTPRLAYRIADRSLRQANPVLGALDTVLDLLGGRFAASSVLELLALPPVRERFGFDDEALADISGWVRDANVRWGLDGAHRAAWGLPDDFGANTWRAALDRLLLGIAVTDDPLHLAVGDIAPLGVEGTDVAVAGRLADLLARLARLAEDVHRPRPAAEWCTTLATLGDELFAAPRGQEWQVERLHHLLADVADEAVVAGAPSSIELTLADLRRLLADRLAGTARRPDFFRGGVTVSSLTPLRWLPYRVVCVLGLDEAGGGGSAPDGDDLGAAVPALGDRDPRAEARQALLEAVLAAGDHLVITRNGHNVRTNQEVPPSVAFAELRDVVAGTLADDDRRDALARIEWAHPRQAFDERNLCPGALGTRGPWSFDRLALAAATARRGRVASPTAFLPAPLPVRDEAVIASDALRAFFRHPVRAFLVDRLGLRLPRTRGDEGGTDDELPVRVGGLEAWSLGDRLIAARRAGASAGQWERAERARGTLPPGELATPPVATTEQAVDALIAAAQAAGITLTGEEPHPVDLVLDDGTRIVGSVALGCASGRPGVGTLLYSRPKAGQHLAAWLDLALLVAQEPDVDWRAVVVRRHAKEDDQADVLELLPAGDDAPARREAARAALAVAVDCYRRGRCEPLPLFASLSRLLHEEAARPSDWRGFQGNSEGDDEAHLLAFGDLDLAALRAIPCRDDDPPGDAPGRADRFARYLWSAIDASAVDAEAAGAAAAPTGDGSPT